MRTLVLALGLAAVAHAAGAGAGLDNSMAARLRGALSAEASCINQYSSCPKGSTTSCCPGYNCQKVHTDDPYDVCCRVAASKQKTVATNTRARAGGEFRTNTVASRLRIRLRDWFTQQSSALAGAPFLRARRRPGGVSAWPISILEPSARARRKRAAGCRAPWRLHRRSVSAQRLPCALVPA